MSNTPPPTATFVPNTPQRHVKNNSNAIPVAIQANGDAEDREIVSCPKNRGMVNLDTEELEKRSEEMSIERDEILAEIARRKAQENHKKRKRAANTPERKRYKKDTVIVKRLNGESKESFVRTQQETDQATEACREKQKLLECLEEKFLRYKAEYEHGQAMTVAWLKKRNAARKLLTKTRASIREAKRSGAIAKKTAKDCVKSYSKLRREMLKKTTLERSKEIKQAQLHRARQMIKEAQEAERKALEEISGMTETRKSII